MGRGEAGGGTVRRARVPGAAVVSAGAAHEGGKGSGAENRGESTEVVVELFVLLKHFKG